MDLQKKSSFIGRIFSHKRKKDINTINLLKRDIFITPTDIVSRRILGDLYLKIKNQSGALEQFIWIAEYYRKEKNYTKAIAIYERIIKIDPLNDQYYLALADIYVKINMKNEAIGIYRRFINIAKKINASNTVINLLDKILSFDKYSVDLRIEKATELIKNGEEAKAVQEYILIVDKLIETKKIDEAEKLLVETNIKDKKLYGKLLICYIEKNKLKDGLDMIKKQRLESSNDIEILGTIIDLYLKDKSIKDALRINKKIFKKDPKATGIFIKIAKYYLELKKPVEAFDYLLPFIDTNISLKNYNSAIDSLNLFVRYQYDFMPALKKLRLVYKIKNEIPLLIEHNERLIPILKKQGNINELVDILKELIEISNTPYTYKQQLKDISDEMNLQIAADEYNKENGYIAYNSRQINDYLIKSDYNSAINELEEVIEKYPHLIEPRVDMITVLEKSGNLNEALETAKKIISYMLREKDESEFIREKKEIVSDTTDESMLNNDIFIDFEQSENEEIVADIDIPEDNEISNDKWKSQELKTESYKKSFQKQRTFKKNISKKSDIQKYLIEICSSLGKMLFDNNLSCRSVSLKLLDTDLKTISKKKTLKKIFMKYLTF